MAKWNYKMKMHKVWRLYLLDNKSITEISNQLNITKNKLKTQYGLK
jgi:DNA-binding transcriptional regulator LsrR (DeoR family)